MDRTEMDIITVRPIIMARMVIIHMDIIMALEEWYQFQFSSEALVIDMFIAKILL